MVTKLWKSKLKKSLKENPYNVGHSKRSEITFAQDIYETLHVQRQTGADRLTAEYEQEIAADVNGSGGNLPRLSRQRSSRFTQISRPGTDTGNIPESSSDVDSDASTRSPSQRRMAKLDSSQSFESLFQPKNNVNRLLTSCAMSSTRNSLTVSGVAAAFYNGGWLAPVPAADKVSSLNEFFDEVRGEVEAGLPGRSLTVVLGNYISDLDSVVSTIAYAFLRHTQRESQDVCIVPVVNMKRADLPVHTEIDWLFKLVQLDVESLIFADEISLSYYHRFGNLRLVLVGHNKLNPLYEGLSDAIVETISTNMMIHSKSDKVAKVGSCCTLISENFASEAPDLLLGRGLSRLLLAGILLQTSNLDISIGQCATRDIAMATLLLNAAGRHGRNGFFKMLRKKVSDLSVLSPREILNKEIQVWTSTAESTGMTIRIGMCTMGISLGRFLTVETGVPEEFTHLQKSRKLDILLIATSYYDKSDKFKRELLIATDDEAVLQKLVEFYNSELLQLRPMDMTGLSPCTRAYLQGNISISAIKIQQITDRLVKKC